MFCHPAWAVGIYSRGLPAAGTVGTKSMEGFYRADGSPCTMQTSVKFTQPIPNVLPPFRELRARYEERLRDEGQYLIRQRRGGQNNCEAEASAAKESQQGEQRGWCDSR